MDLASLGFVALPAITVICYMIAEAAKATKIDNKWLPVVCMMFGAILGILEKLISPTSISGDFLAAIAIGIVSGLSATGVHQVIHQFKK